MFWECALKCFWYIWGYLWGTWSQRVCVSLQVCYSFLPTISGICFGKSVVTQFKWFGVKMLGQKSNKAWVLLTAFSMWGPSSSCGPGSSVLYKVYTTSSSKACESTVLLCHPTKVLSWPVLGSLGLVNQQPQFSLFICITSTDRYCEQMNFIQNSCRGWLLSLTLWSLHHLPATGMWLCLATVSWKPHSHPVKDI